MSINHIHFIEDRAEAQNREETQPGSQGNGLTIIDTAFTGFTPEY